MHGFVQKKAFDFSKNVAIDEIGKNLWIRARWRCKKAHIQGVAVFQGRDYTKVCRVPEKTLQHSR